MTSLKLKSFCIAVSVFALNAQAAREEYPMGPHPSLTPGSMCDSKTTRHPQKIPFCKRSVSSTDKWEVIEAYNRLHDSNPDVPRYDINHRNRGQFKIDHFIPLCIGGSNDHDNLWPQHITIYEQTDNVEHMTCQLVSMGKMKQKDAIELVRRAKLNLDEAAGIREELEDRLGLDHRRGR
ncbi:MAG TPA: hypothetical protein VM901_03640 [Bdellovibrionota bacterium]|nr:hypothetical protein [Bdellovibrionota bacterium]